MFCNRLEQDYKRSREGDVAPDLRNNLWHVLVTTDQHNDEATIRGATVETTLTLIDDRKAEWLTDLKAVASADKASRVRIFLCDDAHKDSKMRPWTDLPAKDFYEAKQAGPDALLAHVAERINEGCRGEFQRSIFVMLSNDKKWVESMRSKLDVWYKELATDLTLPVPDPPTLERVELSLDLSQLVRELAHATGADQAAASHSDLAEKARLYAEPLRILAAGR
jgi:hypothetical protein